MHRALLGMAIRWQGGVSETDELTQERLTHTELAASTRDARLLRMAEIRARDLGAQFKKLWESDAPSAEKQALAEQLQAAIVQLNSLSESDSG